MHGSDPNAYGTPFQSLLHPDLQKVWVHEETIWYEQENLSHQGRMEEILHCGIVAGH